MKWRFGYVRQDRRALLFIFFIVLICMVAIYLVGSKDEMEVVEDGVKKVAKQESALGIKHDSLFLVGNAKELFPFDPNTADSMQLMRLGLREWQVRSIYRYRQAGGVYSTPLDFAKVRGLTVGQYRALEPYIRIAPEYQSATTLIDSARNSRRYSNKNKQYNTYTEDQSHSDSTDVPKYPKKIALGEHVELNSLDTAVMQRVPGIGSYYARQIVQYGKRLGGYVSAEQLIEIDGFPEDAMDYFTVDTTAVKRININKATIAEMRRHPYISYFQAKAIADHRRLVGDLKSLQELHLLRDFPPEVIRHLEPYVEY